MTFWTNNQSVDGQLLKHSSSWRLSSPDDSICSNMTYEQPMFMFSRQATFFGQGRLFPTNFPTNRRCWFLLTMTHGLSLNLAKYMQ